MIFLGQLRHPHLVKLIGYCCEDEHRLLVYEYMARGNLENHLFKSELSSAISPLHCSQHYAVPNRLHSHVGLTQNRTQEHFMH